MDRPVLTTLPLPLATSPAFRTTDLQIACDHLAGPLRRSQGRVLVRRAPIEFIHRGATFAGVGLHAIHYGAPIELDIAAGDDAFLLLVVYRGAIEFLQPGAARIADTERVGVVNPDRRVRLRLSPGQSNLTIRIPRQFLCDFTERAYAVRRGAPLEFNDTAPAPALRRFVQSVCEEFARPDHALTRHAVARPFAEALAGFMLTELPHSLGAALQLDTGGGPPALRRACAYIEESLSETMTLADVADAAAVSPRTLQFLFQREMQTTPIAYVRDRRLELARRILTDPAHRLRSVTDVAGSCGFGQPGKFARAYRERYGELPSATRLRSC